MWRTIHVLLTSEVRGRVAACVVLGAAVFGASLCGEARGDETDQFSLPLDRRLVDLGDYLDAVHCRVLETAARELNEGVRRALSMPDDDARAAALARLHDPEVVVAQVTSAFGDVLSERVLLGEALTGSELARAHPGRPVVYMADRWLYSGTHYWIDPRRFDQLIRASTVRAYGVYFGVDKLVHFHQMGAEYYGAYRSRLKEGMSERGAMESTARTFAEGSLIAESGFLGFLASGVYSNADLSANYAGLKFCINITEPVVLKGKERPPLLVRRGEFWRVNRHVRPESGWFGAFVSDHWNEALNPCWYEWDLRDGVRAVLRERRLAIAEFYTKIDHRPASRWYFDALARDLATFEGEDYGHSGNWDVLMTVGEVCWGGATQRRSDGETE